MWVDTHCHLDAPEFGDELSGRLTVRARARVLGVGLCVYPAVQRSAFATVRELAHATRDAYALGVHPLYMPQMSGSDLGQLQQALREHQGDPRLVAVGEIGLDHFEPAVCTPEMRERQTACLEQQLAMASDWALPVLLHVRRSVDVLLVSLRRTRFAHGGIAHAFNGSLQQAQAFIDLGFKLGFGGALTYERALQLRRLATQLPLESIVLETDAPDMPPHWLYVPAAQRALGRSAAPNEPSQLPRIAAMLAQLRGVDCTELMHCTTRNALQALPRLRPLIEEATPP